MPAPVYPENKYSELGQNHETIYWQHLNIMNQAFVVLNNYDYNGTTGPMPSPINYKIPNSSSTMTYDPSTAAEIILDGNAYSTLGTDKKIEAYKNLEKFFKYCLYKYDLNYNL